jgi:hypothetical protein
MKKLLLLAKKLKYNRTSPIAGIVTMLTVEMRAVEIRREDKNRYYSYIYKAFEDVTLSVPIHVHRRFGVTY